MISPKIVSKQVLELFIHSFHIQNSASVHTFKCKNLPIMIKYSVLQWIKVTQRSGQTKHTDFFYNQIYLSRIILHVIHVFSSANHCYLDSTDSLDTLTHNTINNLTKHTTQLTS